MLTPKSFLAAPLLALALAASACSVTTVSLPLAPPGVRVRPEVARGFAAYETALSAYGTWGPDHEHGVHWCPSVDATGGPDAPFQPYLSRGRWDVSGTPVGGAAGTPVWQSEDPDTWGEITTHHGWWVRVPGRRASPWCWVPGVEETTGRVVWREGDGFVGWAPEPPDGFLLADEVDFDDTFDWVYTLLGTLTADRADQNTLGGEARERARAATAPGRSSDGSFEKQRVGPSGAKIAAAHKQLSSYVINHPDAIAAAAARHPTASGSSGGSGSKSSSSSKSTKKKESDAKEKEGVSAGVAPTPYAMAYYDAFMMEPPVGAAGLPRMPSSAAPGTPGGGHAGAAYGGTPGSSSPAGGSSAHAHASHSAESALRAPSSSGHASTYSGGHASSSSSSRSSSHSSSRSSGKSSSKSRRH